MRHVEVAHHVPSFSIHIYINHYIGRRELIGRCTVNLRKTVNSSSSTALKIVPNNAEADWASDLRRKKTFLAAVTDWAHENTP